MADSSANCLPDKHQTLALVGAGHANCYLAYHAKNFTDRGYRVSLIDPGRFWYSGMATGMLGGRYTPDQDQIDPKKLVEACGGEFVRDQATAIDTANQQIQLASGRTIGYGYLSLNIGSHTPLNAIDGLEQDDGVWPVKPISNLCRLREKLEAALRKSQAPKIAVIGGGPTGCEVAANIAALAQRRGGSTDLTLIAPGERLIPKAPVGASERLEKKLREFGIPVLTRSRVTSWQNSILEMQNGETLEADLVIPALGLQANPLVNQLGLPCDEREGLTVNAELHSPADSRVFAAGDCANMQGHKLPKLGVFGVRQACYVHHNLLASMDGAPLQSYHPQKRSLTILNLGDGTGLAMRGRLWWYGRMSMWLKDRIDRRFVEGYTRSY